MKTGFKKLSFFSAYSYLSIVFGIAAASTIIFSVVLIISLFIDRMPVWVPLDVKLIPQTSISSIGNHCYSISNLYGRLQIYHPEKWISVLSNTMPVIFSVALTGTAFLLRKIIRNVNDDNHFAEENVRFVKIIGWIIILVPHLLFFMKSVILNSIPDKTIVNGMAITETVSGPIQIASLAIVPEYIFFGLLVFVFAEVFKKGNNIKQENDLTV